MICITKKFMLDIFYSFSLLIALGYVAVAYGLALANSSTPLYGMLMSTVVGYAGLAVSVLLGFTVRMSMMEIE